MGYRAGVVGAAGFAGIELVRHPEFDLAAATSDALAGTPIAKAYPAFTGVTDLAFSTHEDTDFSAFDVVFLAVPHKAAMGMAPDLMAAGVTVVDLSADFRLKDSRCHLVGQTMRRFDVMHKVLPALEVVLRLSRSRPMAFSAFRPFGPLWPTCFIVPLVRGRAQGTISSPPFLTRISASVKSRFRVRRCPEWAVAGGRMEQTS